MKKVCRWTGFLISEFIGGLKNAVNYLNVDFKIPKIFGWIITVGLIPINIVMLIGILLKNGLEGIIVEGEECKEFFAEYEE